MIASRAQAQTRIGPAPPITYDNKYELYGGLNYMDFKAGENLPKRMNLGGALRPLRAIAGDDADGARHGGHDGRHRGDERGDILLLLQARGADDERAAGGDAERGADLGRRCV